MPYLHPYRHELRTVVKPLADAIAERTPISTGQQFGNVLDEVEQLVRGGDVPQKEPQKVYLAVVETSRDEDASTTDEDVARAIAAATVATETDVLGALYQLLGRTAEDHFNQYFTPPNVAGALQQLGQTVRTSFDPPTPTVENVSGQSSLGMFDSATDDKSGSTSEPESPPTQRQSAASERGSTVFYDPTCGSGRLLLAAARAAPQPVCLGWELERESARMSALTLALTGTPGWVIGGNALTMGFREVYRIPATEKRTLQSFREFSPENAPEVPNSHIEYDSGQSPNSVFDPRSTLGDDVSNVEDCFEEIERLLRRGIDQTVGNPPFDSCSLADDMVGPLPASRFDTAHNTIGNHETVMRDSQKYQWLFLEQAMDYTLPSGAITMIVPTSMLANPTESDEREWLLNEGFYEGALELPPETFAPETKTGTTIISVVPREEDHKGLSVDYEIFMGLVSTVGHEGDGTRCSLTNDDGDSIEYPPDELPSFYRVHQWLDYSSIKLPDDELYKAVHQHREMRTAADQETGEQQPAQPSVS